MSNKQFEIYLCLVNTQREYFGKSHNVSNEFTTKKILICKKMNTELDLIKCISAS